MTLKPDTLPNYKTKSGWNALLPLRTPKPALAGDIRVDVAIIGAGYTGLAAAKRWCDIAPNDSVAMIDSSEIGEGNPGRNSGFLLEVSLANDADPKQLARMQECNRLIAASMEKISAAVKDSPADCQLLRTGTYRGAAGKQGIKSLNQYRAFLEGADLPFEDLNRQDLAARIGTNFYQQGIYSPHCYLAQPAALVRTLAKQLPASVQLYENTPALTIRSQGNTWLLETPKGHIRARNIIVANNAFAKSLGLSKPQLVAMYTYAGLTPQLPSSVLHSLGSEKNWGLLPTHRLGSTLRRTQDGRLLIRCLYGYEKEIDSYKVAQELATNLIKRFPQLRGIRFDQIWGGAVGFTLNGGAVFGEVEPRLFISAGCNGGGVVKGNLFGELLADLANGLPIPDIVALFGKASWMPPEPIRSAGFQVISRLERFRGRAEI